MIKGRVNKNLNIRTEKPEVLPYNNSDNAYYKPGDEIEIAEKVEGEEYKGNKLWYKLSNGTFVWSGGVENPINQSQLSGSLDLLQVPNDNNLFKLVDYRQLIKVTTSLPGNDGDGINIALLDTGLNVNHPDFNKSNILLGNIHKSWDEIVDKAGHGTHLGGLICASSRNNTGIIGLAPNVKLTIFKVLNDDGKINIGKISKALTSISNSTNIDLVNMSFDITEDDFNLVKNEIESIHNNGIIIVASAGNGKFLSNRCFYPANASYIFSVGSIKKDLLSFFKVSGFYKTVDYFFLDEQIKSLSHLNVEKPNELGQCSVYTAIMSGLIARILSKTQLKNERNKLVAMELSQLAFTYNDQNILESKTLFKTT